jgi:hypothetical protein
MVEVSWGIQHSKRGIIMMKSFLLLIIICLYSTIIIVDILDADVIIPAPLTQEELQKMQEHIEKVKVTNPKKYNDMIERAGGSVTHCCGCHKEVCEPSTQEEIPTP